MKTTTLGAALLALVFVLAACEGLTNPAGSGNDDAGGGGGGSGGGEDIAVTAPDAGGGEDTATPVCEPDCAGKDCGDDGCGGLCEPGCGADETCENFQCIPPGASCTLDDVAVNCEGRECGGDGCGGLCGSCDEGWLCDLENGRCGCRSDCSDLECGPDPVCGASCGLCADGGTCTAGVCEVAYPAGPYGTNVGDTIENLTFYTADGRAVKLEQFYKQEKVFILTSAAGW